MTSTQRIPTPSAPAGQAAGNEHTLLAAAAAVLQFEPSDPACLRVLLESAARALDADFLASLGHRGGRFVVEQAVGCEAADWPAIEEELAGPAGTGLADAPAGRVHYLFRDADGFVHGALAVARLDGPDFDAGERQFVQAVGGLLQLVRSRWLAAVEAQDAEARQAHFLAQLAHELRNPLGAIGSGLAVLAAAPADPTAIRVREAMHRQVALASRLVDDLLDVSRIATGKLTLRADLFPLQVALGVAVDSVRFQLEARQQALAEEIGVTPAWVRGDEARLVQVIVNLLGNAIRFTPRGGRLRVRLAVEDGHALLSVSDTGIGLPAGSEERIFTLYAQAAGQGAEGAGLGIGLALVRSLVRMHGGEAWATSDGPGRGSTFHVRLPTAAPRRIGAE